MLRWIIHRGITAKIRTLCPVAGAALLAFSPAVAAEPDGTGDVPFMVAGGHLDPAYPDADVYIGKPAEPSVPPGKACAVAQRYVELVNARDYAGVAALFAEDATFLEPMRPTLQGHDQINAFFTRRIGAMTPEVMAVTYLGDERDCMIELALKIEIGGKDRWVLVSIDHFILGEDGKIASMAAFARPAREP